MPARSSSFTLEGRTSQARRFLDELSDASNFSYAMFGKTTPWKVDTQIDGISQANPVVITAIGHSLTNGSLVIISGVTGMTQINDTTGLPKRVINVTATSFALAGVDSTSFSTYTGGGVISQILDANPPAATDVLTDSSSARRQVLGYKRIAQADAVMVVPRVDWKSNQIFGSANYSDPSLDGASFYVLNSSNRLYKCLWNNGASQSIVQPTSTSLAPFTSTDGYYWKYMFQVADSDLAKFASDFWLPVRDVTYDDGSDQWAVQNAAVPGTVNGIDALAFGTNYDSTATITIVGDGAGATGHVVAQSLTIAGGIAKVVIDNHGVGYTWAEAFVNHPSGTGCRLQVLVSPPKGDGADPVQELLARRVYVREAFFGDGGGIWATGVDIRRFGIVSGLKLPGAVAATADSYDGRETLTITSATPTVIGAVLAFNVGEIVTGLTSGATGFISASTNTLLSISERAGTFAPNEIVSGPSGTARLVTQNVAVTDNFSGSMIYLENRTPITRTTTQTEYVRALLEF